MSSTENTQASREGLDRIAEYIRQLRFKKALVGGIEQEDAFRAMRDLVAIFSDINKEQQAKCASMEKELAALRRRLSDSTAVGQSQQTESIRQLDELRSANETQRSRINELLTALDNERAGARDSALRSAQELEQARMECETHVREVESLNARLHRADEEGQNLQAQISKLESKLAKANEALNKSDFERETLEEIYLDANRRRTSILDSAAREAEEIRTQASEEAKELKASAAQEAAEKRTAAEAAWVEVQEKIQSETAAHEQKISADQAQIDEQRKKLLARVNEEKAQLEAERTELYSKAKSDAEALLESAKTEASTLVQRAKDDSEAMLRTAAESAESVISGASAEAEKLKAALNTEIEERRGEYQKLFSQLQADQKLLQKQKEEAKTLAEAQCADLVAEAKQKADLLLSDAQKERARAQAEADAMIASAGETYKAERSKYDAMVRKLCDLRMEALQDIQKDISMYQTLAFELSTRGISGESRNLDDVASLA